MQAQATHFVGSHDRDFRQLFCRWIFIDMGIDQHQLTVRHDDAIHGGIDIDACALAQNHIDIVQVQLSRTVGTADHAVSITLVDRHGTDQCMTATHFQTCILLRHALTLGHGQESFPVIAIAAVEVWIDDFELDIRAQTQTEFLDTLFQHFRTTHQNRFRQTFIDHHLHCAQDTFFFTFGVDDPLSGIRRFFRCLEDRTHEGAAVVDELLELFSIGIHVRDRTRCHTGGLSRTRNRSGDLDHQARIKWLRNNIFRAKRQISHAIGRCHDIGLLGLCQFRNRVHGRHFHFACDGCRTRVQRATENIGEAQYVVDLIRIVRTTCRDNGIVAHSTDFFRQNFWRWVGQRHDQWTWCHFFAGADPKALGHKCLAVNLSDLAAMGAQPIGFTLAFALPEANEAWLAAFAQGLLGLADLHGCELIGGDTTKGPLTISITVFGEVPFTQALRRDAAKVGDDIWISGTLGDARLALAAYRHELSLDSDSHQSAALRMHQPTPRVALGMALREIAHAAIDISDGLAGDLGHILERSRVGASLDVDALPAGMILQHQPLQVRRNFTLCGGDDYELCFTAPADKREQVLAAASLAGTEVTRVGSLEALVGLRLLDGSGEPLALTPTSFDHFSS